MSRFTLSPGIRKSTPSIAALAACICFAATAPAKVGDTEPQLVKRFGKSYTVEEGLLGTTYKFRSANVAVDVVVANGRSISETYFSDHPLTPSGEPPNDIVRAVLKTNAPTVRWLEIDATPFGADYALESADHECIAILRYKGPQPDDMLWTIGVGRAAVLRSTSSAAASSTPVTPPLMTPAPTPAISATAVAVTSSTFDAATDFEPITQSAAHIDFLPDQATASPQPRESQPLTPAEIARRAFPSVVLLSMQDARGQPISLGSGFFVDNNVVATNFHVIDQAAGGFAKVIGQSTKLNINGIVGLDALHDLALLQLDSSSTTPLPVAPKLSANIGDAVYAIGNPRGFEGTFSQGIVSSVRTFGSDRTLQLTAPISPGSSGGPVLDQTGTVVGVSFASIENGQNLNFAIPSDDLAALQLARTRLRPFTAVPRAKLRKNLLDHLGNDRPLAGVACENLTYDGSGFQSGEFSYSLHNTLRQNVTGVHGIIVFHDVQGQPIDVYPINYANSIPAGMAKRISGHLDPSFERLNCPLSLELILPPREPKGKVEFRILDFTVE